jgi:glycosyltransferase involved in cell wall biosynthesis
MHNDIAGEFALGQSSGGSGSQAGWPSISLIVATCNRVSELERLLGSLDRQTYRNFEVIVVDQNPDDRLVSVLQDNPALRIRHLRSNLGVSRARNIGIRAAEGDLIAFPDDDCWYTDNLLQGIAEWFTEHPDFDGVVFGARDPNGRPMTAKFPPRPGALTRQSILRCAMAINVVFRKRVVDTIGFFREDIGPGTSSALQSGEDLDYILRPLELGMRVSYEPSLIVYHPELNSGPRLARTAYGYALGVGHVWQTHRYPWHWCLSEIVLRSFGGAVLHLCKGDPQRSYTYLLRAAGQFRGYFSHSEITSARHDIHPIPDDHA